MVTFSSGSALDAMLAGVPVVAYSPLSPVYGYVAKSVDGIENISMPKRDQILADLAYTQWNFEEVRSGEAWKYLRRFFVCRQQGDTSREA